MVALRWLALSNAINNTKIVSLMSSQQATKFTDISPVKHIPSSGKKQNR